MTNFLAKQIDTKLPQTQCQKCGYPTCWEYAKAVSKKDASTDHCVPGGRSTAGLLNEIVKTGSSSPTKEFKQTAEYKSAQINEPECIGCTLCIKACPFDAIVGAKKSVHTVLTADCSGCELCVSSCPVDCIAIRPLEEMADEGNVHARQLSKKNYEQLSQHNIRNFIRAQERKNVSEKRQQITITKDRIEKTSTEIKCTKDQIIMNVLEIAKNRLENRQARKKTHE